MRKATLSLLVLLVALGTQSFAQAATPPDSQHLPSIPVIVAKKQFVNQVGSINSFTLYTVKDDVDLIIYSYLSTPSCTVNGIFERTAVGWTDDDQQIPQSNFADLGCSTNGAPYIGYGSQLIHAKAGTPIQVSTSSDNVTTYSLYITLERL